MQHKPKITRPDDSGQNEWEYRDGDVFAVFSSDLKSYCEILEFSSSQPGKGNGREAVEWMKKKYREVIVNDPGNEIDTPESFLFWRKLADNGLIQTMVDGDSIPIFNEGQWVPDNLDAGAYPNLCQQLAGNVPGRT